MQAIVDERNVSMREREISSQSDRLAEIRNTAADMIKNSALDDAKARELDAQIERFTKDPCEMPNNEYSSMVVSVMLLDDSRSDSLVSDILRERTEREGKNITGKEETALEDRTRVIMQTEVRQGELVKRAPELSEIVLTRRAAPSPDIDRKREEIVDRGEKMLSSIRDEQKAAIKDYVKNFHGGLEPKEQERLSDKILAGYIARNDKNSVSNALNDDISKLSEELDKIAFNRTEEVKTLLDACVDKTQGNAAEFIDSRFNQSSRAGETNRFTEVYQELKSVLPPVERLFYSDARMRGDMRDEALKECLKTSFNELHDLKTADKFDRSAAERAAEGLQEVMLESRLPSSVMQFLVSKDLDIARLNTSVLETVPDPTDIYESLDIAQEKLAIVLDPKYRDTITDEERQKVIASAVPEVISCDEALNLEGELSISREEMELKHSLLEELARQSNLCGGSLEESLHGVNYTIDLREDPVVARFVSDREANRAEALQDAREHLETALSGDKLDEKSLRDEINDRNSEILKRSTAADELEKTFFNDPRTSYMLTAALRNSLAGRELSEPQRETLSKAQDICELLNEARSEKKELADYYPSLEWDKDNLERTQAAQAAIKERRELEKNSDKIQDVNNEMYKELYSSLKDDLHLANSKYDQCQAAIDKLESSRTPLSKKSDERLSELKDTLSGLKADILRQGEKLNTFSYEFENSLLDTDSRYEDIKKSLEQERDGVASDIAHRTGVRLNSLSIPDIAADKFEKAAAFADRCDEEMRDRKEKLSVEKIDRLLERPQMTKEQQIRYDKSSAIRETILRERQDAIARVRSTFSKEDLERMDRALEHNVPCNVIGFNDYVVWLEKAKEECNRNLSQLNTDIKTIYTNRLREVSDTLTKFEDGRAQTLVLAKNSSLLSRTEEKELLLYKRLSEEEKSLSNIISDKFGDDSFKMELSRYDKKTQERNESVFAAAGREYTSEDDARSVLKKAADILSDDTLDYDKCKNIAADKALGKDVDSNRLNDLKKREAAEKALESAFGYLVSSSSYTSDDRDVYESIPLISKDRGMPVRSNADIRDSSNSRTRASGKLHNFLYRPITLGRDKERSDPVREISDIRIENDTREEAIKDTIISKLSDSWDMIRSGNARFFAANVLNHWADRLSPKK